MKYTYKLVMEMLIAWFLFEAEVNQGFLVRELPLNRSTDYGRRGQSLAQM